MPLKQLTMGEVEDLLSLFKKNDFDVYLGDDVLKIFFKDCKNKDDVEQEIQKIIGTINRSGQYDFILGTGKVIPQDTGIEVDIVAKRRLK